jgi:EGF-like domain
MIRRTTTVLFILIATTAVFGNTHGIVINDKSTTTTNNNMTTENNEGGVSCDLECSNGGYCTLLDGTEAELAHKAQSGMLIEVCVCPPGYTGVTCENVVEECTLPERTCHNKVPCRKITSSSSSSFTGEWSCDCSLAESISNFAGRMCRDPITEYCTGKFTHNSALSFCTNGGRCLGDFIAAKIAPGDTSVNKKYQ